MPAKKFFFQTIKNYPRANYYYYYYYYKKAANDIKLDNFIYIFHESIANRNNNNTFHKEKGAMGYSKNSELLKQSTPSLVIIIISSF
jgi:hypothetical protein